MPVLYRASFGFLLRHPLQLGLAVLGICVGVAVMVAVDLANQSSRKAFLLSMDALNGAATHQIVAGPGGVDETLYTRLRVDHGMTAIAPVIAGYVRAGEQDLQLLGVDVFAEREFRSFSSPASLNRDITAASADDDASQPESIVRRLMTGRGSVLVSANTASGLGLTPGDSFVVRANGKDYQADLAGVMSGANQDQLENLIIADIGVAQYWLELRGKLSRIDVRIPAGEESQVAELRAVLPPGVELLSAAGRTQTTADMSEAFMTNLTAMSLLALLVGIFLIYNSVAFAVLQRRELIGVLRALGVTRRQTFRLILIEAAIVGTVGAVFGVMAGAWLGERLLVLVARTVSDHYFVVNVTDVVIGTASVAKGILAGLGATVVAAMVPAIEASSYQPRLALTRSALEHRTGRLVPLLALAGAGLILLAMLLLGLSGRNLAIGLAAVFVLILGFAFCIPLAVRLVSAMLTPLAGKLAGTVGRLAISGVAKSLSRTGVAIVALAIAVSATIGVTVMVDSFRESVNDWLGNTLQSDVYVGVPRGSLDPAVIADLTAIPGIEAYSTSRRNWLEAPSGRTRIVALQMAPGSYAGIRIRDGDPQAVWRRFDDESAVLVSDSYAYRNRVGRGDSIALHAATGTVDLAVAAVYQSYDANDGAIVMSRGTYDRLFDDPAIDSIGLYLKQGTDADQMMEQLKRVAAGRQTLIMNSNARIREISLGIFDRTFVITDVLYWLAVGVAVIGILGAMMALQLERAREFGVLRAIGMTPGQTGVLISMQTGFIGLLAGVAAMPLGLIMAWILVEVINRRAFGWQIDMAISANAILSAMALAIGAALIAGLYPAWRAATARPALAMREE